MPFLLLYQVSRKQCSVGAVSSAASPLPDTDHGKELTEKKLMKNENHHQAVSLTTHTTSHKEGKLA